ncbi:MAG: hypothetical protein QOI50_613 [Pseudonocardiales bacterium]|nr:hypothetical protein [Pseudonocardiales bacterium]
MTGVRTETTPTAITTGTGQGARAHVPTGYPTGASYPRRSNTPTRRAGTDPRDQGVSTLVAGTMAADTATGGMAAAHTAVGTAVVVDMAAAGTAVVVGTAVAGTAVAADTAAAGTAAVAVAVGTVAAADTDESVIVTERSPGTTRRMCILYNFLMVLPLRNHWDRDVSIITSLRSTYESPINRART